MRPPAPTHFDPGHRAGHTDPVSPSRWCSGEEAECTAIRSNPRTAPRANPRPRDYKPVRFATPAEREAYKRRQRLADESDAERAAAHEGRISREAVCPADAMGGCFLPGLQISMQHSAGLTYCRDCRDAFETGLLVDAWDAHYGPTRYHVQGRAVLAVPNFAEKPLANAEQLTGRVGLVFRGKDVSIRDKVLRLQAAGAIAAIIFDLETGGCKPSFDCGALGKRDVAHAETGFLASEPIAEWRLVHIPAVIVTHGEGQRMLALMNNQRHSYPEYGDDFLMTVD
jgi:hypothetical protein